MVQISTPRLGAEVARQATQVDSQQARKAANGLVFMAQSAEVAHAAAKLNNFVDI
jgi:hypothetical protein